MKKIIIICAIVLVVLLGVSQIPAVKEVFSQEKAIKEAIAAELNVPADSVVIDMSKSKNYDNHLGENLFGGGDNIKHTAIIQEEKSGKYFLIHREGYAFSVELAPDQEVATEEN